MLTVEQLVFQRSFPSGTLVFAKSLALLPSEWIMRLPPTFMFKPGREPVEWGVPPIWHVSVTNTCNRLCSFCYYSSVRKGVHIATHDILSFAEEAWKNGAYAFLLGGGEPLLHPDLEGILEGFREKFGEAVYVSVTTNGDLVFERGDVLAYADAVSLSLYPPYSDALFPKKAEKLRNLGFEKWSIIANLLLIRNARLDLAIRTLEEAEVRNVAVLPLKPIGRGKNMVDTVPSLREVADAVRKLSENEFNVSLDVHVAYALSVSGYDVEAEGYVGFSPVATGDGFFTAFLSEKMMIAPNSYVKPQIRYERGRLREAVEEMRKPFYKLGSSIGEA